MKQIVLFSDDVILNRIMNAAARAFNLQCASTNCLQDGLEKLKEDNSVAAVVNIPLLTERCPKRILQMIQDAVPYLPVYFLMDKFDIQEAITLTKLGSENCFTKPFSPEHILENISETINKIETPKVKKKLTADEPKIETTQYVSGNSKESQEMYRQIKIVADTNYKVIIYGETGTGKESVAHRLSSGFYKDKPFVAIDCACLSKDLAASQLFGHMKGSFSGAHEDKKGAFEAANNGTLFLDEVGNLDYSVQIMLLRAIEEKKIKRIGSNEEIDINVRIIVASNEKLIHAVQRGQFREDLYYRLNEFEIVIPPLRQRKEDIPLFINFFIAKSNQDLNKNIQEIDPELLEMLCDYDWPGNIRELKNVVRRACLLAEDRFDSKCLSKEFIHQLQGVSTSVLSGVYNSLNAKEPETAVLKNISLIAEQLEIERILKEESFNKTKTAKRLNINRKTLYNKMKAFGILIDRFRSFQN